jgi:hypothetical protein
MRVLAVDPGGTTGIAFYEDGFFTSYQRDCYEDAVDSIVDCVRPPSLDALVCEGFHIRGNTHKLDAGAFSQTTDLIGACRFVASEKGIPFIRQTPAQAKGFATDDKLRTLGWYNPSKGGHQNDAARHLLVYLAGIRYAPVLEALTNAHP